MSVSHFLCSVLALFYKMNNLFNVKLASVKASHQNKVHKSREGEKKKIEEKRREKRANQFNDRRGIEIEENGKIFVIR